jgi:hypothetical protein
MYDGAQRTIIASVATAVERQAATLLMQTYLHPDTSLLAHWAYRKLMDPEEIKAADLALASARERQSEIDADLLNEARLLCELSGTPLLPWMTPAAQAVPDVESKASATAAQWNDDRKRELLTEHEKLKRARHPAPTKTLAKQHGVSETIIRKRLNQARELSQAQPSMSKPATPWDPIAT